MINHARTLLLNASGAANPGPDYPGEEFVPPDFTALTLPNDLAAVRSALFGPNADRAMCNIRLREVLALIHCGELGQYLLDLDPRVTYWPAHSDDAVRAFSFGAAAKQISGDTTPVYIHGNLSDFVALGRIHQRWTVTVVDGTHVRVQRWTAEASDVTSTYSISGGLSTSVNLGGSALTLQFGTPGAVKPTWEITGLAYPTYLLPDALAGMTAAGVELLFGPGEPYVTLRRFWEAQSMPSSYRLGAAVVTLAYRINEIFQARGR